MPNWCFNRVDISHPRIHEIVELLKSDETHFDFEKVVPMPPILKYTASGSRTFTIGGRDVKLSRWYVPCTGDFKEDHKRSRPFTITEELELAKIGYSCWYDWALANWGTKWNTAQADFDTIGDDYVQYTFHTAWSPPMPVIEALRDRFPEASITAFYDEPGMCIAGYC